MLSSSRSLTNIAKYEVKDRLHRLVWQDAHAELRKALEDELLKTEVNSFDARGNTPLHLAVLLNRKECITVLVEAGADSMLKNKSGFYPLHEARSIGDRMLIKQLAQARRIQLRKYFLKRSEAITKQLLELDDFYMEMKWEFSSWVPLLSRFCPNDTYKIYKKGATMRVDTTLVGFEGLKWLRGNISYIYNPQMENQELAIVDFDKKIFEVVDGEQTEAKMEENTNVMMNFPIRSADFSSEEMVFSQKRGGLLGFGAAKSEMVGDYEADLYTVENLKIKQLVRTEHEDPKLIPKDAPTENPALAPKPEDGETGLGELLENNGNLEDDPKAREQFLKKLDGKKDADVDKFVQNARQNAIKYKPTLIAPAPPTITEEEYFSPPGVKEGSPGPYVHLGRPMKLTTTNRKVSATLWMSTSFPLFVEQLFPLMEIMAPSNEHFARLRDFIDLKLPRGFPIKIEIPLFGILTARVTFQRYRVDSSFDDEMFKVPKDFTKGEIKFFNN